MSLLLPLSTLKLWVGQTFHPVTRDIQGYDCPLGIPKHTFTLSAKDKYSLRLSHDIPHVSFPCYTSIVSPCRGVPFLSHTPSYNSTANLWQVFPTVITTSPWFRGDARPQVFLEQLMVITCPRLNSSVNEAHLSTGTQDHQGSLRSAVRFGEWLCVLEDPLTLKNVRRLVLFFFALLYLRLCPSIILSFPLSLSFSTSHLPSHLLMYKRLTVFLL